MEAMSATLLTVLAVIIACTGYAAGRLHQWYREGVDRDEAYREGYDTATRSTFSLAARLIGPRRDRSGVRASAVVHGGRAGASPVVTPLGGEPAEAGLASVTPLRAAPSHAPSVMSPRSQATAFFAPSVSSVTPPPAAPALSPAAPAPSPAASALSPAGPAVATSSAAAAAQPRPGRHFVPDELVRADTYRLAPDRVARAKVHGAGPLDDGAPDPAARPAVPKPRSS